MMQAGVARRVINNKTGRPVQGASVDNVADSIRDNCEANALLLSNGAKSVLFVSRDVAGLEADIVKPAREAMGKAAGILARNVIIAGTHMHSGPSLIRTNYLKAIDREYIERLHKWLVELAQESFRLSWFWLALARR